MISRRQFLNYSMTSAAVAGASLNPALGLSSAKANNKKPIDLSVFATNWGYKGSFDDFCRQAKQTGYDGIELWLPAENKTSEVMKTIEKYDLKTIWLIGAGESNFDDNLKNYQSQLKRALDLAPVKINSHTGRDYFNFEQGSAFFRESIEQSEKSGITVAHETHRARILFACHISEAYLKAFPELKLTLDISHWVNVASSLLADQKEAVRLALKQTDHVHARVGFSHGPQVNDPRAPEWKKAFDAHIAWWDAVVEYKKMTSGKLTMTTEFGPFPYMPTLPYTKQAVGNQWEINEFMLNFWRERYGKV